MASDPNAPRSRRALLTAAAGGAAAVAASAAMPLTTFAADDDPLLVGNAHTGATETSITVTSADPLNNPQIAFKARTVNTDAAGLVGSTGDETASSEDTSWTGIYGWAPVNPDADVFSAGVWGDSDDVGTYGSGTVGVMGDGDVGVVGRADLGGYGVHALNFNSTGIALRVDGKVSLSRSKKTTIGSGKSSLKVTMPGVTSQSLVFAVLSSNRSGRYVRAVVPTTGSFTIYLNAALTSASFVSYIVVN
jgi:hypothetical protein